MQQNYKKELDTAIDIAREAGAIMLEYFDEAPYSDNAYARNGNNSSCRNDVHGDTCRDTHNDTYGGDAIPVTKKDQEVEIKEDNTQVTIADKKINSLVIERLQKAFPEDGIIGEEESTTEYGGGRKWFCDPIDGTAGYIYGIPMSMFSLALVIDGTPVMGVIYDPYMDKMYTAIKGERAFCNNIPIQVSDKNITSGIVGISGGIKLLPKTKHFQRFIDDKIKVASFSGAVYKCALVARGRLMGYIEEGLNAHDIAASEVIVIAAGGKVTNLAGQALDYTKPFKGVIVSNGIIHDELISYTN